VVARLPQISVIQTNTKLMQWTHLNSLYRRDKTATGKNSAGKVFLSIKYIYWVFLFLSFSFHQPFPCNSRFFGDNKRNSSSVQENAGDKGEISVDLIYVAFGSLANCLLRYAKYYCYYCKYGRHI